MTPIQVLAAIQTIQQAAITIPQVVELLKRKDLTAEDVETQLNETDSTLKRLRDDDSAQGAG